MTTGIAYILDTVRTNLQVEEGISIPQGSNLEALAVLIITADRDADLPYWESEAKIRDLVKGA